MRCLQHIPPGGHLVDWPFHTLSFCALSTVTFCMFSWLIQWILMHSYHICLLRWVLYFICISVKPRPVLHYKWKFSWLNTPRVRNLDFCALLKRPVTSLYVGQVQVLKKPHSGVLIRISVHVWSCVIYRTWQDLYTSVEVFTFITPAPRRATDPLQKG